MTLPRGVTTLLNKAADPWTYRVQHASAVPAEFGGLSEDEDGEGRRRRVSAVELVDSIGVRFDHPDGRAAVAVWVRRAGGSYKFTVGVRGRHEAEYTPVELNARDLGRYLAACGAEEGS